MKVFVFSDTPQLIKLVHNHYVDSGIVVKGKKLTKTTIEQIIRHCAKSDPKILLKINKSHISVRSSTKQKVKPATQLFSNTTVSAIRRCYELGYNVDNACETANFFQILNDWFNVFNTKLSKSKCIQPAKPYGQQLEIQRDILAKMSEIMRSDILEFNRLPFKESFLVNNVSLDGLYCYLFENFSIEYILTSHLNQNILENFFGALHSKVGPFDHQAPLQFKNRLKNYITEMTKLRK